VNYLVKELGFDAAINYKNENYVESLHKVCPKGIDMYFDNVGGTITDNVLPMINKKARIIICGQISSYNRGKSDVGPRNFWILLTKCAVAQGFMVNEFNDRFPEAFTQLGQWIKDGRIKYHENILLGLKNMPSAFIGLFKGKNIGKQLVKIEE
jgi:hypothetical protein